MDLMPASFREWTEILARIRVGKVRAAGKGITGTSVKAVAARYASYADGNGTRIRPGIARVAVDLEMDCRTVKTALAYLRSVGLLQIAKPGGRRGADEYRLTLPTDLLDRDDLTVWSPTEQRAEIERLSDARRGSSAKPPNGPDGGGIEGPQAPAIVAGSQGPRAPYKGVPERSITGASGAPNDPIMGASGAQSQGPQAPATYQDRYTTTATNHRDEDLRTAAHPSREIDEEPTIPNFLSRPMKCPDGLSPAMRPDGKPECPICRRRLARPGIEVPPPPEERLATVHQLDSRRIS